MNTGSLPSPQQQQPFFINPQSLAFAAVPVQQPQPCIARMQVPMVPQSPAAFSIPLQISPTLSHQHNQQPPQPHRWTGGSPSHPARHAVSGGGRGGKGQPRSPATAFVHQGWLYGSGMNRKLRRTILFSDMAGEERSVEGVNRVWVGSHVPNGSVSEESVASALQTPPGGNDTPESPAHPLVSKKQQQQQHCSPGASSLSSLPSSSTTLSHSLLSPIAPTGSGETTASSSSSDADSDDGQSAADAAAAAVLNLLPSHLQQHPSSTAESPLLSRLHAMSQKGARRKVNQAGPDEEAAQQKMEEALVKEPVVAVAPMPPMSITAPVPLSERRQLNKNGKKERMPSFLNPELLLA